MEIRVACLLLSLLAVPAHHPEPVSRPEDPREEAEARRLTQVVATAPNHPAFAWAHTRTPHFDLYAETSRYTAADMPGLGARAERALRDHLALLGAPPMSDRVPLFFVRSRARLKLLTGYAWGGFVTPHNDGVFYVATPEARPALRHELIHRVSRATWGLEPEFWLKEGVATFGAGHCAHYSLHEAAASLLREHRAVPLRELSTNFHGVNDIVAYLQSGSVVQYVHDTYGIAAVRCLWRGGLAASAAATGLTPEQLDAAWRAYLRRSGFHPRPVDWNRIKRHGCE
ncbi:hypothetical protein I2I05_02145 [Hymenobacter sp. BT683]|uniref:DUF1570 domain-containing protein n=1 Tax=Hymenobacter jeongseonensis TaxID=2791027 RepID=A0ABS0ICV8_9BACT|nr:hypothetical protein [Hymenobacter jeongseonensis]MBF9236186.1 hypothetical protein [Hymenobacter jeongseonensis]